MEERIRKLRRTLDLTQEQFAERIGIKRNTVANYESGRNVPIDTVIALICREYKVNEQWLRTGEGEMFREDSESELEALAQRYNLTHGATVAIEKFVTLKPEVQQAILSYVSEVAAAIEAPQEAPVKPAPTPQADADIDEQVEAFRRHLELQKKAEGKSIG